MKRLFLIVIALSIHLLLPNLSHTSDIITTIVGTGTSGYSGNNGPAIEAQTSPTGVFSDSSGDLFIAEFSNNCIRKVNKTTGIITTVAGVCGATGGYFGNGSAATSALLNGPYTVFVNNSDIFIPDFYNNCVRKVNKATGIITDLAGVCGSAGGYSGDGNPALSAQLNGPYSVFVNGAGDIFIADYYNSRIRKVDHTDGKISTFAGTGTAGYSGDGDLATLAQINQARGVFGDSSGNIYIADTFNHRIRKIDPAGYIGSIVNAVVTPPNPGYSGDSGLASIAQLNIPEIVFVDPSGNIFITEFGNHTIRKVNSSNYITTVAGTGAAGFSGECAIPTSAQLNTPSSVFADSTGIFIADTGNNRVRKVTPPILPRLTTAPVIVLTTTSIGSGGNIICEGGSGITERGVCWSTSPNPTTSNNKLINGSGSSNFSSSVSGLTPNTTYYIRAYATNTVGTAYGNELSFTTPATLCDIVTEIPKTECESLVALYNSTNGSGWTDKTGWNVTNTPCSWYGVTCSGGHVYSVGLGTNNLNGIIPATLNLPNLSFLFLNENQLNGTIPDFNLPSLTKLSLRGNQLSGTIPGFGNLSNLTELMLNNNQLTGTIPNFNMPNLSSFRVDYNRLSGTIPNLNWISLANLYFDYNCGLTAYDAAQAAVLTVKDPNWHTPNPSCPATDCNLVTEIPKAECQELLSLHSSTNGSGWTNKTGWNVTNTPCSWYGISCSGGHVYSVTLNNNNLNGTIPNLNLPNLTQLYLLNNQLNGNIPNFNLPNLIYLHLSNNQLNGNIPNFNMPNLTYLGLSINQLNGSIPNFNMPNLTILSLSNNQLSGTIPNFNMPNLINLSLSYNQLTGNIPNFNMPNLAHIGLNYNLLSGIIPNLNWLGFITLSLNNNCGLTAYDTAQAIVLAAKDPNWNMLNPSCPTYTVNFTVNPAGSGTVNLSSQTVATSGMTLPVTASAMPGYSFLHWMNQSGTVITSDTILPAQLVTGNTTYTAYFAAAAPQITGISPAAGLANTATTLTITGSGFPAASVQAWLSSSSATPASTTGLTQITISSSSATQIIGTTPANLAVGTYYVFIYDPTGVIWSTAANSMANVFTVNPVGNIYTWTGSYDQDWFNESNWLLGGSPAPTGYRPTQPADTAIILPVTSNRYPVLQNSVSLNKFTMALGTSLIIRNPGILQVNDTADVKGVLTLEDYGNILVPPTGTFSINTGGVLRLNGGGVQIHPSGSLYRFRNFGTIEWESGSISPMYEPGNPPCSFNNEGNIAITDASAYLMNCNFINSKNFAISNGFLTVSDGSFTNAGTGLIEVLFNSTISFSTSSTDTLLTNKGTLKGRGTIGGTGFTFVNEGIVDPGWLDAGVLYFDPLDIRGNYMQTSIGKLHIDANSSGNDFVRISGAAQLNGTTEFAPSGTFIPVGSFDVLKSDGSMNGIPTIAPLSGYTVIGGIVSGTPNVYRINIGRSGYKWRGVNSDTWTEAGNWDGNAVPSSASDSVLIPANCPNYPHINSDVHIGGISIEQNASLTIHTGFNFNIHGDSTNNGTVTLLGGNVILNSNAVFTNTGSLIFYTPSSGAASKIGDASGSHGKLINTGMIVNQSFSGVLDVYDFEQIPTDSGKGISILSGDLRFASGDTQNTYTIGTSLCSGNGTLIFGSDNPDTYPMIIFRDSLNVGVQLRWVSGVVEKASDVTAFISMILSKNTEIGSSVFKKLYGMDMVVSSGNTVTLKDGEFYLGNKANFKIDGGILSVEGKMLFYNYDDDETLTGTIVNNGTVRGTGILSFTPNPSDPKPAVVFTNNGIMSPGLSPGKLTIQGDYAHGTGILTTEIGVPTSGMYDELAVIGNAALSGTLTANFPSGFTPTQDSDFKILTATGSLTGAFASPVNLPIIPGFHWEPVHYVSNSTTGSYVELKLRKDTSLNALDVVVYPTDGGSVSGANGLISCGTVCSLSSYPANTSSLTLSASANSAYQFDHWELNGVVQTDTQPSLTISTSIANIVKAIFRLKLTHTLSVSVSPSGSGSVSVYVPGGSNSGLICPPDCSFTVPAGTQVSLYATPNSGNTFLYWSGTAGGSSASTEITMNTDKSVTAYFGVYVPPYEPPYYPPEEPDEPDTPDDPDNPDNPDQPDTPDTPDVPDTPDDPDNPDNPDQPDTPDTPDVPDTPDDPDNPDNPDQPDTPDTPDVPDTPDNPDYPPDEPPVITLDPPEPPAIVSPAYQDIIPQPPVKLIGTPFKAFGDQTHIFTHWLTHRADTFYRPGNKKDALFNDYIGSYSSGNLTSHSFADAVPGMKYVWKTGYIGSGNPKIVWSGESSFIVGIPEPSPPIDILPGETTAQYQMFSIPYWLQNEDAVAALGKIIGSYDTKMFRIGGYDAAVGGFVEYGQGLKITPGRAYWILSRNGVKLTVHGVPVNSDQTAGIVLDKGWNMIAPPNNADYDWTLLDIVVYDDNGKIIYQGSVGNAASADYIDADLWLWAGSENDYVPTTVLEKGKGCWIKAKYPGVVLNFSAQARINAASARSVRRSSSSEKPPMPMGNTGFSINSDNIDAGGGCFIDSAAN